MLWYSVHHYGKQQRSKQEHWCRAYTDSDLEFFDATYAAPVI